MDRRSATHTLTLLCALTISASAHAQTAPPARNSGAPSTPAASPSTKAAAPAEADTPEAREAQQRVNDAAAVLTKMKSDPRVSEIVQSAKGLLIVPHLIKAALLVGGQGGPGLMLIQSNGRWSDPAFYRTHSGSFGAQIGGAKGALVMILTSDKAVEAFTNNATSWSVNAGAGLTAASYSKATPESGTLTDVVIWSDVKGLFGGAAVGATRVASDRATNQAYYNRVDVTPEQILSGLVANPSSNKLREVLPMQRASR